MRTTDTTSVAARFHRLTKVSRAVTYATPLDKLMELAIDCAQELLEVERVVVMLSEPDGRLRIGASRGVSLASAAAFREPPDETLVSKLEVLFGPGARRRFLGVPLVVGGKINGLLVVDRTSEAAAAEDDEWLLSALADQLSAALENSQRGEQGRLLQ